MGSSCKKSQQITITEEFKMDILDEPLKDVHIFHPKSSKPHYQVEEYEDGVMIAQITAILVKPKTQFETIKILKEYCSVQEKIKQKQDNEQKKIHNQTRIHANSEKHVHWGN